MLILTRKLHENIIIGDNIVITILSHDKWRNFRVGISAPKAITVLRGELYKNEKPEQYDSLMQSLMMPETYKYVE